MTWHLCSELNAFWMSLIEAGIQPEQIRVRFLEKETGNCSDSVNCRNSASHEPQMDTPQFVSRKSGDPVPWKREGEDIVGNLESKIDGITPRLPIYPTRNMFHDL